MPDTLLYYITIQYFILFLCFLFFLTIHKHKYRGNMIVLSARIEGRGVGCMSELSMKNACGINSIVERGVLHASKERKRISKVQDSLVFQKRLQLRDYRQQVCPNSGQKFFSTSWLSKLGTPEDDVFLDFLKKKKEDLSGSTIRDVEKD
jgi:hypothetical protein